MVESDEESFELLFKEEKILAAENIENLSIRQEYMKHLDDAITSVSRIPTRQGKAEAFVDFMQKRLLENFSTVEVSEALGLGTPNENSLGNPKPLSCERRREKEVLYWTTK